MESSLLLRSVSRVIGIQLSDLMDKLWKAESFILLGSLFKSLYDSFLNVAASARFLLLRDVLITVMGTALLYFIFSYLLRSIFRKFERDFALVTLQVSTYPALFSFLLIGLKVTFHQFATVEAGNTVDRLLSTGLIIVLSYWLVRLCDRVIVYYLKEFTRQSEVMWDDVLLPLLEAVVPIVVVIFSLALILNVFGVDLTGIWVALGGATVVVGFATQDILANFFSGVVLLIDTPFQFGDAIELEDGSVGMLRRIGLRVTHLYMFDNHCDIYIPNSILQGQKIINLSRPTDYYHYSSTVQVPFDRDLDTLKQAFLKIMLAHPDTLGNLETKLEVIEQYFHVSLQEPRLAEQQEVGQERLRAENEVNLKLEEIDLLLASIVVTLKFAERGGLTKDEVENIQREYQVVLQSMGLSIDDGETTGRAVYSLNETQEEDTLIELIRAWYRISMRDPNLLDEDEEVISEEWERRLTLLKRRAQGLYQKIARPDREETRLDDYALELRQWLTEKFKTPRKKWQDPQVLIREVEYDNCLNFELNFFVDDIKLENGRRGDRVSSQIHQEIVRYLKASNHPQTCSVSD